MTQSSQSALGIRVNPENPNHHLYNNNGTWFIHYTVYPTPITAERVRRSLRTRDLPTARRRRDSLFARLVGTTTPAGTEGVHVPGTGASLEAAR